MESSEQPEEILFQKCLELPPEERDAFLDSACGEDHQLRESILSLIESHEAPEGFLDSLPFTESFDPNFGSDRFAASDECAGDQIGRYKLIKLIGEGAWGSVWLADQTTDIQRRIALKILKLGFDTKDFLIRFNAERQILAMMSHPYITTVLDAGATDYGRPYLVMEYVDGKALLEYANQKRLSIEARLSLFIKVCEALHHAHQKGVIHRDVKPSNVLVTEENGQALPKVIDFGVAKTTRYRLPDNTHLTNIHTFIGTPVYCSPEQLDRRTLEIDQRSDIYSLGAILYELLCFRTPFDLKEYSELGVEEVRTMVRERVPARPSTRFARLSSDSKEVLAASMGLSASKLEARLRGDLDWIIMKCLEKEPARRYDTAQSIAEDLQSYLQRKPVSAGGPSPLYRVRKYLTRKRTTYAIFLEISLPLIVILATTLLLTQPWSSRADRLPGEVLASPSSKSIAVLPLKNLSAGSDSNYLVQGVQEAVTHRLSRIAELRVITRNSTESYKDSDLSLGQIASELGVRYLVQGSIEKVEGQLTVRIRLHDSENPDDPWTEIYHSESSDVLAIQSEITKDLARQLHTELSSSEISAIDRQPTQNQEAYDNYQIARFLSENTFEGGPKIAQYEKVVALDPTFAEAWAELAIECIRWWEAAKLRKDTHLQAKAHRALEEARRLDSDLPDIPYAESSFSFHEDQDLLRSIEFLESALAIDPQFNKARLQLSSRYFALGYVDKALAELNVVKRVDPKSLTVNRDWFVISQVKGNLHAAQELAELHLASNPGNERWRRRLAQVNYLIGGSIPDFEADIFEIKEFVKTPRGQVWLSLLARDFGRARHFLEDLEDVHAWEAFNYIIGVDLGFNFSPVAVLVAMVAFEVGEQDKALEKSRKATEMMEALLRGDPEFDPQFWSNLVICYALQGELEKLEAIIPRIREAASRPFWKYKRLVACELRIAIAYLILGNEEKALDVLEAARPLPSPIFFDKELELWYVFDRLRGNPRFEALKKTE